MTTKIILPEMGEGVIEGTISRWLVGEGDEVQQFDPIVEIETDKVTTEITTEVEGTILKLLVDEGETIPVDTILAYIGQPGERIPDPKNEGETESATNGQTPSTAVMDEKPYTDAGHPPSESYTGRISPLVGRIATEHNVDLNRVSGTGRDGRITKEDILSYIEEQKSPGQDDFDLTADLVEAEVEARLDSQTEEVEAREPVQPQAIDGEKLPMTAMRRAIADHMVLSKRTSPHVTTVFEIDFSAVASHRARQKETFAKDGAKLTFTVYMVAATVQALKMHPLANSVWSDEGIILKREINISMAVAVPWGLIVPVIKGADGMNLLGLARIINDLADRARSKKLILEDLQDGTFSITNHGTSGSLLATPIINQPQAGILGFGKIEKRVKVVEDAIAIRPLAYASFTFDHRILDGATADAFMSTVKGILENWS
jgi:pyruvate/2-oxoglutarate dehydrogenase complex dihydrolipoamide acyltransferase (E2) component